MNLKKWMIVASAVCFSPLTFAAVIDFDSLATGTIVDNEYAAAGVTFNGVNVDRGVSNMAVVFDTTDTNSRDDDLESPFANVMNPSLGISNPGNVLIIHEHPGSCDGSVCANPDDEGSRPAGYFEISFATGVTLNSLDFFDIEDAENGYTAANAIKLFDFNGDEILAGSFHTPHTGGDNTWDRLDFGGVSGVYSMQIGLKGSGAIDNLNFSVPEPGTFALFALGLAGLGLSRRRLKNA